MVVTIPELIEPILLYLDMRSLLTSALRVCRQWHDVIQGSISLQRALFFACDEKLAEGHEAIFNPLLVEMFPLLFDFGSTPKTRGFNDLAIEALPVGRRRAAFYRLIASWRRMYIRHPPVRNVGIWTLDTLRNREEVIKMMNYDEGLTMEGFYFLLLKHVYWWDLFVKWGESRGQQLPHFRFVRNHMVESAKEMVYTADVTIGGLADDYCVYEGNARRLGPAVPKKQCKNDENTGESTDDNALLKMGLFWFKVQQPSQGRVLWERVDGPGYQRTYRRAQREFVWVHDHETNTDRRIAII